MHNLTFFRTTMMALLFLSASLLPAQISITSLNTPFSENFDSLASTGTTFAYTNNVTLTGWYHAESGTAQANYTVGTGSANGGTIYSYGVAGTNALAERAFGELGSGTPGDIAIGVRIKNNTGSAINQLTVQYTGEEWRDGGNNPAFPNTLYCVYKTGTTITTLDTLYTGFTPVPGLNFTTPIFNTASATLDGNAAANRKVLSAVIPVNIPSGNEIMIKWIDINNSGNDAGFGIDDFSVTAKGIDDPNMGTFSAPLDFGVVNKNASLTLPVTIANTGLTNVLNVTGSSITGTDAAKFSLVGALPTAIAVQGSTATLQVKFDPAGATGSFSATLNLTSNDGGGDTLSIPMTATTSGAGVTPLLLPQYIQGLNGTNTNRVPFAFRATLTGLTASATYRYFPSIVSYGEDANNSGAGNIIFADTTTFVRSTGPSLATAGNFGSFTTDSAGTYTGNFILEPSGSATRFIPGNNLNVRIVLNNGAGGTTAAQWLTTAQTVHVVNLASFGNTNSGTGLRATTTGYNAFNFVYAYDNTTAIGRPLSGTVVESDGIAESVANSYASFYGTSVDAVARAFGMIIPNVNASGVRRIEQRDFTTGNLVSAASDADGVWPNATPQDTRNPTGGTTEIVFGAADLPVKPTTQANGITFSAVGSTQLTINWTNGNGANRLVVAKAGSAIATGIPADLTAYTANTVYGSGTAIGDAFAVFNGSGTGPVTVTGLTPGTTYYFEVYEYNGSGATANFLTTTATNNPNNQLIPNAVSSINRVGAALTNASSVDFNVTFAAAITGLTSGNFTLATSGVSGTSISNVSGSGTAWTVTVATGTGDGSIGLDLTSSSGVTPAVANIPFTGQVYTIDKTAPHVSSITRANGSPTDAASVQFSVTFDESVSSVTTANFSLTTSGVSGAAVTGVTGSGSGPYTVTVDTGVNDGTVRLDMANSTSVIDGAGNAVAALPFTTGQTYTVDKSIPSVTMTSLSSNPTGVSPIPVTMTFSESVTGFVAGSISTVNGSVSNFAGSGANYTFDLVPTSVGTVTADIAAGVAQDGAGHFNTAATQFSRVYSNGAPGVVMTSGSPNPTNTSPIHVTVTFSAVVTGFTSSDVVVSSATLSNFAGSGLSYSFDLTPTSQGLVTADIPAASAQDLALNDNLAAPQFSRTYDTITPTVLMTSTSANPTSASLITVTVTFSEPVINFISSDVIPVNAVLSNFSGTGAVYTFDLAPSSQGTFTADIAAAAAQDLALNDTQAAPQFIRAFDSIAPTVSMNSTASNPTATSPIPVTVTFSELVTGFTSGDVVLSNATINNFSGSGANYSFDLIPSAQGAVTADIPAAAAYDAAVNANLAASQLTRTYSTSAPGVVITSSATNPTNASPMAVTVTFSEAVTGFIATDIVLGNATLNSFAGSGAIYTFNLVPSAQGAVTADIAAGVAQSASLINNSAAVQFARTFDSLLPGVTMNSAAANPTRTSPIPVTVNFTESVTGFTAGSIAPVNATITGFTGSGSSYSFNLVPTANGTVRANIPAAVCQDAAGNLNTAAAQFTRDFDNVAPVGLLSPLSDSTLVGTTVTLSFTALDSLSGISDTRLYVKTPGSASFVSTALHTAGTSGQFVYTMSTAGVYGFAAVSTDPAGNVETLPTVAERTAVVNLQNNLAMTYIAATSNATFIFPMLSDLDVSITLVGATPGGQLTVERHAPRATPPATLDPARLVKESLSITGSGLGAYDGKLAWQIAPSSLTGVVGSASLAFECTTSGTLTHTYVGTRVGNTLTVNHIAAFSEWFAGSVQSAVQAWTKFE